MLNRKLFLCFFVCLSSAPVCAGNLFYHYYYIPVLLNKKTFFSSHQTDTEFNIVLEVFWFYIIFLLINELSAQRWYKCSYNMRYIFCSIFLWFFPDFFLIFHSINNLSVSCSTETYFFLYVCLLHQRVRVI